MLTLSIISVIAIVIGVIQCFVIILDSAIYRQSMPIMSLIWPLIGLYFPIIGICVYYAIGRKDAHKKKQTTAHETGHHHGHSHHQHDLHEHAYKTNHMHHHEAHRNHHHMHHSNKPFWQSVFVSTTHCTGGCALGDMIGPPVVYFASFTLLGSVLFTDYVVEFVLAFVLGIVFQYYGMNHGNQKPSIIEAIKADALSLIAFEVGMFGWMALVHKVFFTNPPTVTSPGFWFMMQIAMIVGFVTSFPANWFLIKKGMKHRM